MCPVRGSPRVSPHGDDMSNTPNDQRSNVKNLNNPAQKSAQDHRANQLNPNNTATKGQPAKK
jgi:hypothetical protein